MPLYPLEIPLSKKTLFDEVVGSMTQSKTMYRFNEWLASHQNPEETPSTPASSEFQKMGAEAQDAVGIPKERQVPINEKSLENADGQAEYDKICMNKENFLKKIVSCYGYKRCLLHHEAIHIKYNDRASMMPAAKLDALTGSSLLKKQSHYCERRADIEGCYATECSACVQDYADIANKTSLKDKGYLSIEELEAISRDLKQQNKLCPYHHKKKHNDKCALALISVLGFFTLLKSLS